MNGFKAGAQAALRVKTASEAENLLIRASRRRKVGSPGFRMPFGPSQSPSVIFLQFQLVQCSAAIGQASAAAVAAQDGNSDEPVVVEHDPKIGNGAILIGTGSRIRCAEGV